MRRPPMPWAKWSDGESLGWRTSFALWRHFFLPYRTAEFLGYDEATFEMQLGPWQWHRPHILWRARVSQEKQR